MNVPFFYPFAAIMGYYSRRSNSFIGNIGTQGSGLSVHFGLTCIEFPLAFSIPMPIPLMPSPGSLD